MTQLRLAPDGTVAWIAEVTQGSSTAIKSAVPAFELWCLARGGRPRRLASGDDIDPLTLRLTEHSVRRRRGATL